MEKIKKNDVRTKKKRTYYLLCYTIQIIFRKEFYLNLLMESVPYLSLRNSKNIPHFR